MSYLVTAACVIAKDQEGKLAHRYEGDVISWLSDEQAAHFLENGLVESTSKGVGGADPESEESDGHGPPAKTAPKADWVDYAESKGYDRAEVEEMTKADIQDLDFG
ncbi:hypothetical protein [Mycolicibacterium gilvum]|uniref:hypothetical protein n=1 Tax=Mycolicibacterium gilvum TaxID=1804 RepID=UPI004045B2BF